MKKHKFNFDDVKKHPHRESVQDMKKGRKAFKPAKQKTTGRQRGRFTLQE